MISTDHVKIIAGELGLREGQASAAAELIGEGATVPFIARYRKEKTGSLDEVAVKSIRDRLEQLEELDKRRVSILKSLEENGHLTEELRAEATAAKTLTELEDLYLPYKPKRKTRAVRAREKGLEPLADIIFDQNNVDPAAEAEHFIDEEKGVQSAEEALSGARDIIAERVNENAEAREALRRLFMRKGSFTAKVVKGKEEEGASYRDYFDWNEPIAKAPSHRVLAMMRAEKEGILSLHALPAEEEALNILKSMFVKGEGPSPEQVEKAVEDAYSRLLAPSMENEVRSAAKEAADRKAIEVFGENLRQLLLAPPMGRKRVLAVDPGFRTGCKAVCLDAQGKLLHRDTVYPHRSDADRVRAAATVKNLIKSYDIEAVAIGNGTAGRETEAFVRSLGLPVSAAVVMVNESGASVYSASDAARSEFPGEDITVRGSVSIGRRLQDPLAELIKIDPKSIGVGQYQHDVDQKALKKNLDDVVVSCVNAVGVDVNTASRELLSYVSGLGPKLADNIVRYRDEKGPFGNRRELMEVPGMGPKSFQQCAGFLRIDEGGNPLDASAVHPESYHVVEKMARDAGCGVKELMKRKELRENIDLRKYVTGETGLPTLKDIMDELAKPGRDPRNAFEEFRFTDGVNEIDDLKPGMKVAGVITNITAFGAFCDVGVHQDGLIHISEMADRFVKDPADEVKLGQKVTVKVLDVDKDRKRIGLSLKQ